MQFCEHERRAAVQPAARQTSLAIDHQCTHEHRAAEQPEARQARLERLRERNRERRAAEQPNIPVSACSGLPPQCSTFTSSNC